MEAAGIKETSRLIAYAKALDLNLDIIENFSTRFNLQKLAFLIRILYNENVDDFNLYKRGPYSSGEAALYYEYANKEFTIQAYPVHEEYKEKLKAIFLVKNEKVIEGTATVLYLITADGVQWLTMYKKLKEEKPNLSVAELVNSVNLAKVFSLTKEKRDSLHAEAERESAAWEAASLEDTAELT